VRPSGADNYLRWRRSIDEHLELRRLTWDEYALFNWLCTKANPRTGTLRTSWPTLAEQTTLSAAHVEKLCRGLKQKAYIAYPNHRGARRRLVEVAIGKFPLTDGTYTTLLAHGGGSREEVPTELLSELGPENPGMAGTSPPGRKRKRLETTLRVRSADRRPRPDRKSERKPNYPTGLTRLS